jgi:hypothetical protein
MMMVTMVIVSIGMVPMIGMMIIVLMVSRVAIPASTIGMRMGWQGRMRRGSGRVGRKWRMRWLLSHAGKAKP